MSCIRCDSGLRRQRVASYNYELLELELLHFASSRVSCRIAVKTIPGRQTEKVLVHTEHCTSSRPYTVRSTSRVKTHP